MTQKTDSSNPSPRPFLKRNWVQNSLWLAGFLALYLLVRPFMQGDVATGPAPEIKTVSITGKPIELSTLKGQPVVVHLWATWCPVCELEHGNIESLAKDYKVINIATQSGSNDEILAYAKAHDMNPNNIVNDKSGDLMARYGAKAVPATFLIGKEGNIQFIEVGYTTTLGLKLRLWSLQ